MIYKFCCWELKDTKCVKYKEDKKDIWCPNDYYIYTFNTHCNSTEKTTITDEISFSELNKKYQNCHNCGLPIELIEKIAIKDENKYEILKNKRTTNSKNSKNVVRLFENK